MHTEKKLRYTCKNINAYMHIRRHNTPHKPEMLTETPTEYNGGNIQKDINTQTETQAQTHTQRGASIHIERAETQMYTRHSVQ